MFENLNDEQLMTMVKEDNLDALAPLFEKYHIKLYNFFLRMTNNTNISEDLTQNVFSRILQYRTSYKEDSSFRSWMYQIGRNIYYQHYNENKKIYDDFYSIEEISELEESNFEDISKEDEEELLYQALNKLEPEQKEIIELSRFQKLKYKEIAEITGNSVPAIKVKVHRAIKKLKSYYFELV